MLTSPPMVNLSAPEATGDMLAALGRLDGIRSAWAGGDEGLTALDQYYAGKQPLRYMSTDLQRDLGDAVTQLVINWPQMVADSHAERHVVTGFVYPSSGGSPSVSSETLWAWWQANDMDGRSNMAQLDAIALSRAALLVGPPVKGDDTPSITAESAFDVAWVRDPRTGLVSRGLKAWADVDDAGISTEWRNLYVPGRRITLRKTERGWVVDQDVELGGDVLPLVPMPNRPRLKGLGQDGRSEFVPIIPLANAANKMATDMMISGEFHAMPRRWVFGLKASDFKDPATGQVKNVWSVIKGRLWANENPNVKVGQFEESSLSNFHDTIKLLARLTAQLSGLPTDYMSFESVNPPSADALRASERRMVKRCEDQQIAFSEAYEQAMRLAIFFGTQKHDPAARLLTTDWRDPGTPTKAQVTDATVKAVTTRGADGRPLVPTEQGRIDMGYTPQQRETMKGMEDEARRADPMLSILNGSAGAAG